MPGRGHWREGRRGWGPPGERRPPWWPEGEPWPPQGPEAWRELRRGFARRAAGAALGIVIVLVLVVVSAGWLISSLLGSSWAALIAAMLALLLLAAVARGVRVATAPLAELIEASGRVEAGELGSQVPERGPREVRALTRAFNTMSARLALTEEQRRRLLAEVSHELRTPLTVIQGNVEGMLDGLYPADRAHLELIRAETAHLERLIDDLRTLSLADVGGLSLQREAADLGQVARDAVAAFEAQAEAAGIALTTTVSEDVPELQLDARRIHQVIANLVSNALRHTPRGGRVAVTVTASPEVVSLAVTDTGVGMEADAIEHAFDRFWSGGESPGAGLGLAIVRDLVEAHGGSVAIRSEPGRGTTLSCSFPIVGG